MAEEDRPQFLGHTVIIDLGTLDDPVHLGLILREEKVDIRCSGVVLNADDALLSKILEDILSIIAKLELVLIDVGHQEGDDVVNSRGNPSNTSSFFSEI